jgi:ATP-dependent DNA ligase
VSKRAGSIYRGGESREWLKTKCHETGIFVITGFSELGPGRLERSTSVRSAMESWSPAGQVKFGLARTRLWDALDLLRDGPPTRKGFVPVRPKLIADVKFFGRYQRGFIRDGVLLSVGPATGFR